MWRHVKWQIWTYQTTRSRWSEYHNIHSEVTSICSPVTHSAKRQRWSSVTADVTVIIISTLKTLRSSRKHRIRVAQVVKKFSICCGKPQADKIILSTGTNDGTLKHVTRSSYKTIIHAFFYNILILSPPHLILLSQMLPSPQVFPIKILYAFRLACEDRYKRRSFHSPLLGLPNDIWLS